MYIVAGLLVVGLIANLLVKPVDSRFHHRAAGNADATSSNA
jgi:hypothetical protein